MAEAAAEKAQSYHAGLLSKLAQFRERASLLERDIKSLESACEDAAAALAEALAAKASAAAALAHAAGAPSPAAGGPGPALPAERPPDSEVEGLRDAVRSVQMMVTGVEQAVPLLAPRLEAAWVAYQASGADPQLTQTAWILQQVTSSLMDQLVKPASAACLAVVPPPAAAPSASHSKRPERPRSSSPCMGRGPEHPHKSRTPPRRRGDGGGEPSLPDTPLPDLATGGLECTA